ncbi:MAG TPA: histidine kinase dimerization/phospho-acceptor domain-containing protein [Gemmatimonadaceae bacterium]|nr:histidine kinase dimerization/phospho-acceptor domain-containing protein [Gemmatimonadaceae bacterium]
MNDDDARADAPRLAVVADEPATESLVKEALATVLPGLQIRVLDPRATALALEQTDCVIIDVSVAGESGVSVLRRIRAAGYAGGAVLLVESSENGTVAEAAALGGRCVERCASLITLGEAVAEAIATQGGDAATSRARDALRRTHRLVAAGEIALRMQHSLNNPLAALLAETQLLAMEPLDTEHQAAIDRIVALVRRVIGIVRRLDGVASERSTSPPGERAAEQPMPEGEAQPRDAGAPKPGTDGPE